MKSKQSGVVLLLMLMLMAILSVSCVSILSHLNVSIDRVAIEDDNDRTLQVLSGGEALAISYLRSMHKFGVLPDRPNKDNQLELYNEHFDTDDGGVMHVVINDRSSCVDVNGLFRSSEASRTREQLELLSANLNLNPGWIDVLTDWGDRDSYVTQPDGREDDYYASLDAPYRTNSSGNVNYLELPLLRLNDEVINKLYANICFVPNQIKVNVYDAEDSFLKVLLSGLSEDKISLVIDKIKNDEMQNDHALMKSIYGAEVDSEYTVLPTRISVMSSYTPQNGSVPSMLFSNIQFKNEDVLVESRTATPESYHLNLFKDSL